MALPDAGGLTVYNLDIQQPPQNTVYATASWAVVLTQGNASDGTDVNISSGDSLYMLGQTASRIASIDGSNRLISLNTSTYPTLTELSYVKGVTSAIQTQLNAIVAGSVTSVSGTANRITSTGGLTPVIDISAAYVGQTSITTLGTIATGVWSGTTIAIAKGGTGLTAVGTANQILATNNAGTALEYKTLSTSGTAVANDVGVTLSGANAIVINLPTASGTVRGVLASADWTTFNSKLTSVLAANQIFVGSAGNVATAVAMGGDATIVSAGTLTLANTAVTPASYTYASITVDSKGRITAASNGAAPTAYTFSTGLTNTASTITNNLSTGVAGGQTLYGGTAASNILTIASTTNATKAYVRLTDWKAVMGDIANVVADYPTFIEFWKGNGAGVARTAKTSMGSLGTLEVNFSSNMDYTTNQHLYYDSTQIAAWMYLGNNSDIFGLQYVASGNPNVADIYTDWGCRPFYVTTFNQPTAGTKGVNGFSNVFSAVYNFADTTNTAASTATAATIRLTSGALLYASPTHTFTGTLTTTFTTGINVSWASASSAAFYAAMDIRLTAGYTGATKNTHTAIFYNLVAATGTALNLYTSFTEQAGNSAITGFTSATTVGTNNGGQFEALGGNLNVGVIGKAVTNKANTTNIGVIGIGQQATATAVQIGGFFGIQAAVQGSASGALIADNGTSTDPIALFKDNGTTVVSIGDGGAVNIASSLQCDSIVNDTGLAAGTYTPTRSAETNLDGNVTPTEAQYMRVGNTVTVSGMVTGVDPTLTATTTSFELSLPVASNIGAIEDCAGVAFCGAIAGMGAQVTGSVANNTAVITWKSSDVTSQSLSYSFTYQVI